MRHILECGLYSRGGFYTQKYGRLGIPPGCARGPQTAFINETRNVIPRGIHLSTGCPINSKTLVVKPGIARERVPANVDGVVDR